MTNQDTDRPNDQRADDGSDRPACDAAWGSDSTVHDWHGQEVDRDVEAAEEALRLAGGDPDRAEDIFDDIRPDHPSDQFKVPASERPGTIDPNPPGDDRVEEPDGGG